MQTSKKNFRRLSGINGCEACGYNVYPQILTLHHIYAQRNGHQAKQAPGKTRRERYLCVCPNCHVLIECGIIDDRKLLDKILETHFHGSSNLNNTTEKE